MNVRVSSVIHISNTSNMTLRKKDNCAWACVQGKNTYWLPSDIDAVVFLFLSPHRSVDHFIPIRYDSETPLVHMEPTKKRLKSDSSAIGVFAAATAFLSAAQVLATAASNRQVNVDVFLKETMALVAATTSATAVPAAFPSSVPAASSSTPIAPAAVPPSVPAASSSYNTPSRHSSHRTLERPRSDKPSAPLPTRVEDIMYAIPPHPTPSVVEPVYLEKIIRLLVNHPRGMGPKDIFVALFGKHGSTTEKDGIAKALSWNSQDTSSLNTRFDEQGHRPLTRSSSQVGGILYALKAAHFPKDISVDDDAMSLSEADGAVVSVLRGDEY